MTFRYVPEEKFSHHYYSDEEQPVEVENLLDSEIEKSKKKKKHPVGCECKDCVKVVAYVPKSELKKKVKKDVKFSEGQIAHREFMSKALKEAPKNLAPKGRMKWAARQWRMKKFEEQ